MRWGSTDDKYTAAQQARRQWHRHFLWFPRKVHNGRWAWLHTVWRCEEVRYGVNGIRWSRWHYCDRPNAPLNNPNCKIAYRRPLPDGR